MSEADKGLLSEEEVGALFDAVKTGGDAPAGIESPAEARPFVPRSLDGQAAALVRLIERVHPIMSREITSTLGAILRWPVEVVFGDTTERAWSELKLDVYEVCLELAIGRADAFLSVWLPDSAVRAVADRLLGGPGEVGEERRPLTELEKKVSRRVLDALLQSSWTAWSGWLNGEMRTHVSFAGRVVSPSPRSVAVTPIRLNLGEVAIEGALLYWPPALRVAVGSAVAGGEAATPRTLADRLDRLPLKVAVRTGGLSLPVTELLGLNRDQVVLLGPAKDLKVEMWVEGRPRCRGRLMIANGGRRFVVEATNPAQEGGKR